MMMKKDDFVLMVGAAIGVFIIAQFIMKKAQGKTSQGIAAGEPYPYATMITQNDGWQYFTDGTAIGPNGDYYKNGQLIYTANGMYGVLG